MSKGSKKLINIAYTSMIAALYVVLTLISASLGFAYSGVQLRISEALTILPVFSPLAIPGLAVGCLIANLASPFGLVDIVLGSIFTLISAFLTRKLRKIKIKGIPILSPLPPVLFGSLGVSAIILIASPQLLNLETLCFLSISIGLGQFFACYILGIPLFIILNKLKIFDFIEKEEGLDIGKYD